jgi:hypothetical protein
MSVASKLTVATVNAELTAVKETVVALSSVVDKTVSYITNHPEAVVSVNSQAVVDAVASYVAALPTNPTFSDFQGAVAGVAKAVPADFAVESAWDRGVGETTSNLFDLTAEQVDKAVDSGRVVGSFRYTKTGGKTATVVTIYLVSGKLKGKPLDFLLVLGGNRARKIAGLTIEESTTTPATGEVVNQTSKPVVEDVAEESAVV